MADHRVITDWRAYFESLGPREPYTGSTHGCMYPGEPNVKVVFASGPDDALEFIEVPDAGNCLDEAKALYEAHGCPRMWLFTHLGGSPWACDKRKNEKRR